MINDVWKKFDEIDLRHSSVHHLLAIDNLIKDHGYARATDVASHLKLSRASVSITLRKLIEKGYVSEDQKKFLRLSAKGNNLTKAVLSKRHLLELFFSDILGVSSETAEADACKIEHLVTDETSAKLLSFIELYLSNNETAIKFRKEFAAHVHHCDDESCAVCRKSCYFAGKEELFTRT